MGEHLRQVIERRQGPFWVLSESRFLASPRLTMKGGHGARRKSFSENRDWFLKAVVFPGVNPRRKREPQPQHPRNQQKTQHVQGDELPGSEALDGASMEGAAAAVAQGPLTLALTLTHDEPEVRSRLPLRV